MAMKPAGALSQRTAAKVRELLPDELSHAHLNAALRELAKWRTTMLERTYLASHPRVVRAGPFKGMRLAGGMEAGSLTKLLGHYEAELADVIETVIAQRYPLILDIGAAQGYYAVGLAMRMPETRVQAFDSNAAARDGCAENAALNGVADRVILAETADHDSFDICHTTRSFVLCDIEGAEDQLLDPATAHGLRRADILVECHDCFAPNLSDRIAARFDPTHNIQRIDRHPKGAALPEWADGWSDLDRLLMQWEWRAGPTPWLWMQARDPV